MKKQYILFPLLILFLVITPSSHALQLVFKRIVFDGSKRSDSVIFINNTNKEATFRVSWREMVMTESQGLKDVASYNNSARNLIKYSPRRVTVPANSPQQIRLLLRRPGDLADGEYRSHLIIKQESPQKDPNQPDVTATVSVLPAITLPVFVRKGNLNAQLDIVNSSARRSANGVDLALRVQRTGEKSVYMDIHFICNPDTAPYLLKRVHQAAIYTDISQKNFRYSVATPPDKQACQQMTIRIIEPERNKNLKGKVLASQRIDVL